MKRLLCPQLPKPNRPATLAEDEANHAVRVLRLRDGDTVEAIDGQGHSTPAILRTHGGPTRLELASGAGAALTQNASSPGATVPLRLEIAILKGDAMEWVVEKAVELGARSLQPLLTDHTVVQIKGKGPDAFRERWQKIADQALKQCGRLERLIIEAPLPLADALASKSHSAQMPRFWCDEAVKGSMGLDEGLRALGDSTEIRLLIGPEGGWSEKERSWLTQSGCSRVALGPLVLRAETAALYATSLTVAHLRLTKTDG